MIGMMRNWGLTSDLCYAAAAVSIGSSIVMWILSKDEGQGHGERFGIFIGLWAPTFVGIGNALAARETAEGLGAGERAG